MKPFWLLFSFAAAGAIFGSACSFQVIPGATLLFFSIQAQYAL